MGMNVNDVKNVQVTTVSDDVAKKNVSNEEEIVVFAENTGEVSNAEASIMADNFTAAKDKKDAKDDKKDAVTNDKVGIPSKEKIVRNLNVAGGVTGATAAIVALALGCSAPVTLAVGLVSAIGAGVAGGGYYGIKKALSSPEKPDQK